MMPVIDGGSAERHVFKNQQRKYIGRRWEGANGGQPVTNGIDTVKTIANCHAYATTIFDYTRRAMPYNVPHSLTDDEVYSLAAYILALNKLTGENDAIDAKTLPQVKMQNRDNFIMPYPDRL